MRNRRLALLIGAAVVVTLAWRTGLLALLRDPAHAKAVLLASGPLGSIGFVLAFGLLQPIAPIPGTVFMIVASLVWPLPTAIVVSLLGSVLACTFGFWFSRYVARDWVRPRVPARLRAYDERIAARGFLWVFLLRTLLWTNQGVNALFGLSKVSGVTHFFASVLAMIPVTIVVAWLGEAVVTVFLHLPAGVWMAIAGLVLVAWGVAALVRAKRSAAT